MKLVKKLEISFLISVIHTINVLFNFFSLVASIAIVLKSPYLCFSKLLKLNVFISDKPKFGGTPANLTDLHILSA